MNRLLRRATSLLLAPVTVLAGALAAVALSAPPAAAGSPFGVQHLIVVLIEHPHNGCPIPAGTPTNVPQCPRYTASQWQTIFQRDVDAWFRAESYNQTSFQVHVLVDPDTADGWWPAPRSQDEYKTHDAFTQVGSIGRDAGEVVMGQALDKGVVTPAELQQPNNRLIMMDNFHARGGTTYAIGGTITYHPNGIAYTTSTSLIPEAANDQEAKSLAEHELTHQLGAPDLYQQPCDLFIPGDIHDHRSGQDNDCVGPWDHMALDFWGYPGYGAYTRQRLRYLNPASTTAVREVSNAFSGTVTLDPVERPAGGALVLRVPNDSFLTAIQKAFGIPGPYRGFMVECRRRIVDDTGIPAEGALVTYYDPSRAAYAPITVARQPFGGVSTAVLSTPGASYANSALGVKFTYAGHSASGGCIVDVNKTRRFYFDYVAIGAMSSVLDSSAAFGGPQGFSGFAGNGVLVSGAGRPGNAGRAERGHRKGIVQPVTRGKRATIRFQYANTGTRKAHGGTATVRVTDPYAVSVCGKPERGRVVGKVRLKSLKPGHLATGKVSFVPRSNGPIGVTVSIARSGKGPAFAKSEETGSLAFVTASSTRKKAKATKTTVRVTSSKKGCAGPVLVDLVPLVQPDGWTFTVKGGDRPLAPGRKARLTLVAKPPVGAKASATQVPVAVQVGEAHHPGDLEVPYGRGAGDLQLLGGLDLMLRVGKPGHAPPFVLAGPAVLPPATSYPAAPPTPTASTLALTCPPSPDFAVTVPGTLSPATAGAPVTVTYRQNTDGEVVTHQLLTDVNGHFTDSFTAPRAGWTVQASWSGDAAHTGATSNSCEFAIPIG